MPAVRSDRPRRGQERQPHVVVHARRRQQRGVPDEQSRAAGGDGGTVGSSVVEAVRVVSGFSRTVWRTDQAMFITQKHLSRRTVLRGMGATVALPFLEAMVPARTALAKGGGRRRTPPRVPSRWCTAPPARRRSGWQKNMWSPAAVGPRLRSGADQPDAARAVARLPHDREQHRRAQRRGVHDAGDRRRSLPLERGVPDAGAPEADEGLERPGRHVARPALRAAVRPGDADSRRCSCASRASIRRAAARTATPASTPTPSAGRRRTSRCR